MEMDEIGWENSWQAGKQVEMLRYRYGHVLSSHAFSSLYLWRNAMGLKLYLAEDCFTVKCTGRGSNTWFFPCGEKNAVYRFLERHQEADFSLCYLRKQDVEFLEEVFPGAFLFQPEQDADEYLYDREGHRTLRGKAYANVRTQLHKVMREHRLWAETLTEQNVEQVWEVLQQWSALRQRQQRTDGLENASVDREGILCRKELGITGIIVYMDGEPYAVEAGYPLSGDTYDLYLSKEKAQVPGLAYYAKRIFFLSLDARYRYINMEEDLGLEGLRKMKTILAPVEKNLIWQAGRKGLEGVHQ